MTVPAMSTVERLVVRNIASRRRLQRRFRFVSLLGCGCAAIAMVQCRDAPSPPAEQLSVGFIDDGSEAARSALAGVQLGIDEAASAGRLVGRTIKLETAESDSSSGTSPAATELIDRGVFAIVGGFDEASCLALSELAAKRNVLYVNVACRSDALRQGENRNAFHIEASDSVYFASLDAGGTGGGRAPVLWHGSLQRYGAAQLNHSLPALSRSATTSARC